MTLGDALSRMTEAMGRQGFAVETPLVQGDTCIDTAIRAYYEDSVDETTIQVDDAEWTLLETHRDAPSMSVEDLQRYEFTGFNPDTKKTVYGLNKLGESNGSSYEELQWQRLMSYDTIDEASYETIINAVKTAHTKHKSFQADLGSHIDFPTSYLETIGEAIDPTPTNHRLGERRERLNKPYFPKDLLDSAAASNVTVTSLLQSTVVAQHRARRDTIILNELDHQGLLDQAQTKIDYLNRLETTMAAYQDSLQRTQSWLALEQPNRVSEPTNRRTTRLAKETTRRINNTV